MAIIDTLRNRIYQRTDYDLLVCDLGSDSVLMPRMELECRLMDSRDVESLRGSVTADELDILKGRLEQGRKGYAACIGGEIAAFAWTVDFPVKNQWFEPFVVDIFPKAGSVYIYDCFTSPAHRNKGAMSVIMHYVLNRSRADGYRDCFYLTKNPAMRYLGEKIGYNQQGTISMRRLFGKQIIKSCTDSDVCMVT